MFVELLLLPVALLASTLLDIWSDDDDEDDGEDE